MNIATEGTIIASAVKSCASRQSVYLLRLLWCFLLCMVMGADAYATSACDQWSMQSIYVGWQKDPIAAMNAMVDFCNASDANANGGVCQWSVGNCGMAGPSGTDCVFSAGTCTLTSFPNYNCAQLCLNSAGFRYFG